MGHEEFEYQRIFLILKTKIESGIMSKGSLVPSSAKLCKEYKVSDKTMRRVFAMLADAGLIETRARQRAIVIFDKSISLAPAQTLKEPNPVAMTDILKTAELLCYPLICRGISLCKEEDWSIPEQLIYQMDPAIPSLFWKNSKLFWRFFIARCENKLALRAVDGLGFFDIVYQEHPLQMRIAYRDALLDFVAQSKNASYAGAALGNKIAEIYHLTPLATEHFECAVPPNSPLQTGILSAEQWLTTAEERYSSVYLDILGLIAADVYRPGSQLPSHAAMQKQYNVSVTTTLQAIRMLKKWGVVEAIRGKGIFVSANLRSLEHIDIPPQLIARYIKRYLETLELLSLTVGSVSLYVAAGVSPGHGLELLQKVKDAEHISKLYQPAPIVILEFLTEHLPCDAMRAVYMTIQENFRLGRKIPKLVSDRNTNEKLELHDRCVNAVRAFVHGNSAEFAKQTAEMFHYMQQQTILECKRLHYLEALAECFDGAQLWK